jgi:hypothetical protein
MISDVNSVGKSSFQPEISQRQGNVKATFEPMNSFADEDQAIISSEAKMLNELDKFNSGADNLLQLVGASINAKYTVQAEARVIDTKKEMMDTVLQMGE